jgi:DNA-binding transcriptional regulator YdaS (Cro superfamily)
METMTLKEYFSTEPMGAVNEMAEHLGITPTWLSLLIHERKRPSPELAVRIEKATQGLVPRNILRPDLFVM